jgi:hypothetical protein
MIDHQPELGGILFDMIKVVLEVPDSEGSKAFAQAGFDQTFLAGNQVDAAQVVHHLANTVELRLGERWSEQFGIKNQFGRHTTTSPA